MGPDGFTRLVAASADPRTLPDKATWYLATNLPPPRGPAQLHRQATPPTKRVAVGSVLIDQDGSRLSIENLDSCPTQSETDWTAVLAGGFADHGSQTFDSC